MRHPINCLLLLASCILTRPAQGQDLSGTWEGSDRKGGFMRLVIVRAGNQYVGYTFDRDGRGSCQANFAGSFSEDQQRLKGGGKGMIRADFGHIQCNFNLGLSEHNGYQWLEGRVKAKGAAGVMSLGMSLAEVMLKRVSNSVDTTDYMRDALAAVKDAPEPKVLATTKPDTATVAAAPPAEAPKTTAGQLLSIKEARKTELVQEIETAAAELQIQVFDNGLVDGDTVSILHNNVVVADRIAVTAKAFTFTLRMEGQSPVQELTLIAHNLGTVAPNTASLVITAGAESYRLTASTDLGKNAMIRIRKKQ